MKSRTILIVGVSPCEACWKIFIFLQHGHKLVVENLYFHLEDEHPVYFKGKQHIDAMMSKKTVKESMFTPWMEANKIYPQGRKLTYPQYVSSFVCVAGNRC